MGLQSNDDARPLVLHIVYRFDVGGLENGVVNLINHMPANAYRHAVLALTEVTDFRHRIEREDVELIAMHKPPGHGVWLYPRLIRTLRALRPAIVHSRNLAALETLVPAWFAGVRVRVHGEHGRDVDDLDGTSRRYQWLRRLYRPFVTHYVALSEDLASYLHAKVGVAPIRVTQVYNGVDTTRFHPVVGVQRPTQGCPFDPMKHWIVGTVGRMQTVKDQTMLARGFARALELRPELRATLRLVMVGDGPLRASAAQILDNANVGALTWLPGERNDVEDVMRGLNCFALPSLAEGISNTILEAMASGLPVIATDVGGNAELVTQAVTGHIVLAGDPEAMAAAIIQLADNPALAADMGRAGRARVESKFSMQSMVASYQDLYDRHLNMSGARLRDT